jgi:tetratricopeptide (TPR) repeat protein
MTIQEELEHFRLVLLDSVREQTLKVGNEFLAAHPDTAEALYVANTLELIDGRIAEARNRIEGTAPEIRATALGKACEALVYRYEDDSLASFTLAKEAYAMEPENRTVAGITARTLEQNGDPDQALEILRRQYESDPEDPKMAHGYVLLLIGQAKRIEAEAILDSASEAYRQTISYQTALFTLAIHDRDFQRAEGISRGLVERQPDSYHGWSGLALALERQSRLTDAESAARRALECHSYERPMHRILARCAKARGDAEEAQRLADFVDSVRPRRAIADRLQAAKKLIEEGKRKQATTMLIELEDEPNGLVRKIARQTRLPLLIIFGNRDQLGKDLEKFEQEEPDSPYTVVARWAKLTLDGDLAGAMQALDAGLARHPGELLIQVRRIEAMAKLGKVKESKALAETLVQTSQDSPAKCCSIYVSMLRAGLQSEAIAYIERCMKVFPESTELKNVKASHEKSEAKKEENRKKAVEELGPFDRIMFRIFNFLTRGGKGR